MKKALSLLLAGVMCVGLLAGCGGQNTEDPQGSGNTPDTSDTQETGNKTIDTLRIAFVPSREPDEIITATEPLKQMLTDELAKLGYDVGEVDITVGTSYEAVGEALAAGTADVGLIPGGTYVLYDDGCDVLLTATRDGLSIDSDNAKDWNDNAPTEPTTEQVTSYRALMIAGPSAKGQELAAKVNAGEALTWEDVSSANWSVANSSSPAGYIYPSLWLQENFDKNITDLPHAVQSDSYGSAFARLASGQVDIVCTYADARRDYEDEWTGEYGMTNSIWDDTAVVGVTPATPLWWASPPPSTTTPSASARPLPSWTTTSRLPCPRHSSTSATPRRERRSSPSTATTATCPPSPLTTTPSGPPRR